MAKKNDEYPIPQETLNAILARALETKDLPENQPVFLVDRSIFPNSRIVDYVVDNFSANCVAVYNEASTRHPLELGTLVKSRLVGPFDLRLVRVNVAPAQEDAWQVVAARTHGEDVVVLTYASGSAQAHEVATRYAEEATEVDLTSDFNPEAHYFGERRVQRRA